MKDVVTQQVEQQEKQMRTYSFASRSARENVNLLLFADEIEKIIHSVIPNAKITVTESSYTVDQITCGEAISIGRKMFDLFGDENSLKKSSMFVSNVGAIFEENALYYPAETSMPLSVLFTFLRLAGVFFSETKTRSSFL